MFELSWRSEAGWIVLRGTADSAPVHVERWAIEAAPDLEPVVACLWRLVEDDLAIVDGAELHIPNGEAAALSPSQRRALDLPEAPPVTLSVRHRGTLESDTFGLEYNWFMTSGRPVVGPRRDGALLTIGARLHLLPRELFDIVEAIDAFNKISASQPDERAAAWVDVQEHLPSSEEPASDVQASQYLREVRVAHAGAFSLRPFEVNGAIDFDPVLFAAKRHLAPLGEAGVDLDANDPPPLLPPHYQETFANRRFRTAPRARGRYVLEDGWILVLSAELRRAMDVVHKAQRAGGETARDFVRNPRGYLREALGDELDEHLLETLFKETGEYSQRVQAVGLWQKKVLPWVQVAGEPWLPPTALGLIIDGSPVQLPADRLSALIATVEGAVARGKQNVMFDGVEIPASHESLAALGQVQAAATRTNASGQSQLVGMEEGRVVEPLIPGRHVLLVKNNFEEVVFNSDPAPRTPLLPRDLHHPLLRSTPKSHQHEGIGWLQDCWQAGWTGALLADDMGLGKTFQALAFLAWVTAASRAGYLRRAPVLIVAPTGLLRNWEKEHELHLAAPGVGRMERVYGAALQSLRITKGSELKLAKPLLDVEQLAAADLVLTTYETLRDYQHSFGQVPFLVAVFDEAQKIKTPGTLVTDAAKAMQADFVLALTGTPIENRLADLWCIMDTLHPGALGDLKAFSRRYEANPAEGDLKQLKEALSTPGPGRPAVMLRRMKDEVLDALPSKTNHVAEREMPSIQANAYATIVKAAREETSPGRMLECIQAMRQVSFAPLHRSAVATDADYIRSSGRLLAAFDVLDQVRDRDEKALIFVEYREAQADLAGVLQRRYGLAKTPMIIAGDVSGEQRQSRVDVFQASPKGFDVIVLSPKAGGVGITLTAANHVVHLTRWWNPAVEDQSTDRCYRIGQDRPVNVYYPMAVLPGQSEHSFDRRLHALLERKRKLSRDMLMPVGGTAADAQTLFSETVN